MQLIYRPERELIPRSAARYLGDGINDFKIVPGLNTLPEQFDKYWESAKDTEEIKNWLKMTVLEVIEPETTHDMETSVKTLEEALEDGLVAIEEKPKKKTTKRFQTDVQNQA